MKKLLAVFFAGLVACLFLSAVNWKAFVFLGNTTFGVASPNMGSYDLTHLGITKVPEFSSGHFFFRRGFVDVDRYLSFVLPPELARAFLNSYVKEHSLPAIPPNTSLRDYITPSYDHKDWRPDLWFKSVADLSEAYHKPGLFCGYSAEKNRIYLMDAIE